MADDFRVQVEQWVVRAKGRAQEAFRAIAQDASTRVKELTPVRTGYLRANWSAILDGEAEPKPGAAPPAEAAIGRAALGDTIHVLNPVVYARRVEFGFVGEDSLGRKYNQRGRGMVQQTVAEMPRLSERAVARVRGR
jgi:hypothetical protein